MQIVQYNDVSIPSPIVFIGIPDVGLVGSIAVSYIIDKMQMQEIGYIESDRLPPILLVREGRVKNPIRIYSTNYSIAVIADIPLPPNLLTDFSSSVSRWLKGINTRLVVNMTGLPVQNRMSIDRPQVLYVLTDRSAVDMKDTNAIALSDGIIMGVYASIIKSCMNESIPVLTLLTQSHSSFPDPFASIEALSVINKALSMNIDLSELRHEAELIRIRTRELMKQTENILTESRLKGPTFYG
jgi:uncharacterized protein